MAVRKVFQAPIQRAALARAQDGEHLEAVARQAGDDDQGEGELERDGAAGWSQTSRASPTFSRTTEAPARRRLWSVAQREHRHELVGDADDQHDEHAQRPQMRVRVHGADLVEARRERRHRLQPVQERAEWVAGGQRRRGFVSCTCRRRWSDPRITASDSQTSADATAVAMTFQRGTRSSVRAML